MSQVQTFDSRARARGFSRTIPLLLGWFFVALGLGVSGALATPGRPPVALGLAIGLPLLTFWLDGRRGYYLFHGIACLDAPALAALQTFRVVGVVFLIAWWRGALPAGFALPAGIGDVAIGLSAPFVAAALARGGSDFAGRWFVAWNTLGLADLVVAVSSGVTHSRSAIGFFVTAPSTDAMAVYPLSLIPTFFVPLALMLHVVAIKKTTQGRQ